jgi:SAM-dependent methyltransferase
MVEQAEFDRFADEYEYRAMRARNISASGESPDFFDEYKIKDAALALASNGRNPAAILDFGSGVGNSVPYFRKYFPHATLTCADVSSRCLALCGARHPGGERYAHIADERLPLPNDAFDMVFSACVFHHIDHAAHAHWLAELHRVAAPGGTLFIFEHNPWNPLTTSAIRACPVDENAVLIAAPRLARRVAAAGWVDVKVRFRIFFPHILAKLRVLEPYMTSVPLGAQYYVTARKAG